MSRDHIDVSDMADSIIGWGEAMDDEIRRLQDEVERLNGLDRTSAAEQNVFYRHLLTEAIVTIRALDPLSHFAGVIESALEKQP